MLAVQRWSLGSSEDGRREERWGVGEEVKAERARSREEETNLRIIIARKEPTTFLDTPPVPDHLSEQKKEEKVGRLTGVSERSERREEG